MRARRALSGARRQAEFDAFGAGGAIVATSLRSYPNVARARVASSRCSFRASPFGMCSSPVPALLSRCSCGTPTSPSAVEPGLLLRLSLQSCWGVLPPLPLWRRAATSADPSGMVAPRQRQGLLSSFVRGQNDFQASSVLRTQGVRCSCRHALAAKVAVVSASSSTCWLEFFDCRSFFPAPPAGPH